VSEPWEDGESELDLDDDEDGDGELDLGDDLELDSWDDEVEDDD